MKILPRRSKIQPCICLVQTKGSPNVLDTRMNNVKGWQVIRVVSNESGIQDDTLQSFYLFTRASRTFLDMVGESLWNTYLNWALGVLEKFISSYRRDNHYTQFALIIDNPNVSHKRSVHEILVKQKCMNAWNCMD